MATGISGGAYIPPAKLKQLQASITDKQSAEYQRLSWEALKKSIHGLVNKVNIPNITQVVRELFKENIIRGRGLLVRSIIQAQQFSPTFTNVYAALIAILNTKFPQICELTIKRLILQFRTTYRQNKKDQCLSTCLFIAHLINQNVLHEILALQILTLLLENPTNHSVEIAIGLLRECGKKLQQESPKSLHAIFDTLRTILQQDVIDKRIQYMIEVMFAIRKDDFKDNPIVIKELDLIDEADQYTHMVSLDDADMEDFSAQQELNIFKLDENFLDNEEKYRILKKEILDETDESGDEDGGSDGGSDSGSDESGDEEEGDNETEATKTQTIIDETETNLVALRRTIYLTIQSSLDFQECAHKLLKMQIKKSQEIELCQMILDSCAQQRTYERFFGLLAQRFCQLRKEFVEYFEKIFKEQYDTVHRLETVKLRNVSKFFSHLFYTDSISWGILECIHLNEDETTSSSRVFIKNLFLDLSEHMGIHKLKERLMDVTLQEFFKHLFPRDNPRNTRFSINFFTSIGLGPLTDDLREHLKSMPKMVPVVLDTIEKFDQVAEVESEMKNVKIKKEKVDVDVDVGERTKGGRDQAKKKAKAKKKKTKRRSSSSSSSDSSSSSSGSSSSDSSSSGSSSSSSSSSSSDSSSSDSEDERTKKNEKVSKKPDLKVKSVVRKHRDSRSRSNSPQPPPAKKDKRPENRQQDDSRRRYENAPKETAKDRNGGRDRDRDRDARKERRDVSTDRRKERDRDIGKDRDRDGARERRKDGDTSRDRGKDRERAVKSDNRNGHGHDDAATDEPRKRHRRD